MVVRGTVAQAPSTNAVNASMPAVNRNCLVWPRIWTRINPTCENLPSNRRVMRGPASAKQNNPAVEWDPRLKNRDKSGRNVKYLENRDARTSNATWPVRVQFLSDRGPTPGTSPIHFHLLPTVWTSFSIAARRSSIVPTRGLWAARIFTGSRSCSIRAPANVLVDDTAGGNEPFAGNAK